ncbi:MAG: aspartate aminotransferase family protein [Acidobacteria bacterium]|nr:aspartate aminotransferase family protein [Acidobacteriota bacterium]
MTQTNHPGEIANEERRTVGYRSEASLSKQLYQRAEMVMPGGNSRHSIVLEPYPVYASHGRGSRIVDVEGQERIDFLNNFTSLILGHADAQVTNAVQKQLELGTAFTLPTQVDVELAELLVERVPYIDQIRFCNSGSEAVMMAVKAARAFTGRSKIAKFEGAYHGIYDYVQVSEGPTSDNWGDPEAPESVVESSVSPTVAAEVVVLPWNNFNACRELIQQHKDELSAIIVDPLPTGIGMIAPLHGFIEFLRELTERHGILLISDEVLTFRLSYHGAMSEFGVEPDLTVLGKIIGGGFPVGAVAGRRDVMSVFDQRGSFKVHHGGTFNANPVTMTAGLETMKQMTPDAFDRLGRMGDYIRERIAQTLGERGIPVKVCGKGSLFIAHLTDEELVDFRSLKGYSRTNPAYGELCHEMLSRGIITSPRGIFGCLSTPMTEAELDGFVEALDQSLTAVAG